MLTISIHAPGASQSKAKTSEMDGKTTVRFTTMTVQVS